MTQSKPIDLSAYCLGDVLFSFMSKIVCGLR